MNDSAHILVVDDERSMQEFLEIFFRRAGYLVTTAGDVASARACLDVEDVDLVISDMQMPDGSGLDVLQYVKEVSPETPVVMITAFATTDSAISAMKDGAYDYITKPFKVDELAVVVEKALEKQSLARENRRLRTELRSQVQRRTMVGSGPAMQRVFEMIAQVADTKTNVLVSGESGTGKELVARAIHDQGERRNCPFIAVNCGAIPENLLESELFGYMKGAFTGAVQNKEGLFEAAHEGTLFLDEIGELGGALQVKLLRAIQEKTIRRVGGTQDRRFDVRIVCATNRCLEDEVAAGRFREDLYYRLNVIQVLLPPLRDRPEDIPLLVHRFRDRFAEELGKDIREIAAEAMVLLCDYTYPGNVRELENVIERAVALSRGSVIEADALPPTLLRPSQAESSVAIPTEGVQLDDLLADYERSLIREALGMTGGVKKRAAQLLGVTFRSLRYRLEKLALDDSAESDEA